METPRHREQMNLLIGSLKVQWADRTGYYVGGNMFVHYNPENKRRSRGPDFFLVLNVVDRERKSWVAWQEGMRFPDVIIELLSDTTRAVDTGEKKACYEGLFGGLVLHYDPWSQEFMGYHLHGMRYHEVELDAERKLYSAATGLYLGIREGMAAVAHRRGEPWCQHRWSLPSKQNSGLSRLTSGLSKLSSGPSRLSSSWPCIGVASVTWKEEQRTGAVVPCEVVLSYWLSVFMRCEHTQIGRRDYYGGHNDATIDTGNTGRDAVAHGSVADNSPTGATAGATARQLHRSRQRSVHAHLRFD